MKKSMIVGLRAIAFQPVDIFEKKVRQTTA